MVLQKRLLALSVVLAMVFAVLVIGVPNSGTTVAASTPYLVGAKPGPYVVGLSNSFSGNSWRAEMVAEFRAGAEKLKAAGTLKDYIIADATGNSANQIQQIQNMVQRRVDAIIIDANSETALNPAIEAAHNAGIIVVSFDNVVTSPHAINVNIDQVEFGAIGGRWLVEKLNGHGNIIALNGLVGTPGNHQRWDLGAKPIFDKYPGIKILAAVNADWDQAKGQQAVANLLPSFPKIDGVYSQGGAMTLGAIYAFQAAGRRLVPMVGEANNGLLKVWLKNRGNGFDSVAPSDPCSLSVDALQTAIKALKGVDTGQSILIKPLFISDANLAEFVQPDMPDSLWLPTNLSEAELKTLFK